MPGLSSSFERSACSAKKLHRELSRFRGDPPSLPGDLERHLIEVLRCIHRDPFDPDLNVRYIKQRCRIKDNNVSSRFRYRLGLTIPSYIEGLRLDAACHLLDSTSVGIFDIAMTVGYAHPQTFYNAFRRRFSCTPATYRARQGQR